MDHHVVADSIVRDVFYSSNKNRHLTIAVSQLDGRRKLPAQEYCRIALYSFLLRALLHPPLAAQGLQSFSAKSHAAPSLFACKRAHDASACYQLFASCRGLNPSFSCSTDKTVVGIQIPAAFCFLPLYKKPADSSLSAGFL